MCNAKVNYLIQFSANIIEWNANVSLALFCKRLHWACYDSWLLPVLSDHHLKSTSLNTPTYPINLALFKLDQPATSEAKLKVQEWAAMLVGAGCEVRGRQEPTGWDFVSHWRHKPDERAGGPTQQVEAEEAKLIKLYQLSWCAGNLYNLWE